MITYKEVEELMKERGENKKTGDNECFSIPPKGAELDKAKHLEEKIEEKIRKAISDMLVECEVELAEYKSTSSYPDVSPKDLMIYEFLSKKLGCMFETKTSIHYSKYEKDYEHSSGNYEVLVVKLVMHIKWGRW